MIIIQMLKDYRRSQDKLQNLYMLLEYLEDERLGRAAGMGEINSNRDRISDPTGETASSIIDKENEIKKDIKKYKTLIEEVNSAFKALTPTQRSVIIRRYVYHQQWHEIAREVKINSVEGKRLCEAGLQLMELKVKKIAR